MAVKNAGLLLVSLCFFALMFYLMITAPTQQKTSAVDSHAHPCPYADVLGLEKINSMPNPHVRAVEDEDFITPPNGAVDTQQHIEHSAVPTRDEV